LLNYRKEIDGLRALALTFIVLYHANFQIFKGGYIGVDIFFVISGYLITSIILNDLINGNFSFVKFYERRARRILPALFLVLLICATFAWFWQLPGEMKEFNRSLVASILFVSNITFWQDVGYFDTTSNNKLLVHTWSLSIEEQFYLLFPLFLFLTWKKYKLKSIFFLFLILLLSLSLSQFVKYQNEMASFYLLPFRVWELLIGSLVSYYLNRFKHTNFNKLINEFGGWIGFCLILYAVIIFDGSSKYIGLLTLIPTLGTALIIIFSSHQTSFGKLLGNKVLVHLGLISYSTYLWHQPFFVFARTYNSGEPTILVYLMLIAFSIIFGFLTWKYIENPFRSQKLFKGRNLLKFTFLIFTFFLLFGIIGLKDGYKNRYEKNISAVLDSFDKKIQRDYVGSNFNILLSSKSNWELNAKPKILIIGDSHAQDLLNSLIEVDYDKKLDIMVHRYLVRCGILFIDKEKILNTADPRDKSLCEKELALKDNLELIKLIVSADQIWLISSWRYQHLNYISESIEYLKNITSSKVVLFGGKSFPGPNRNYIYLSSKERSQLVMEIPNKVEVQSIMYKRFSTLNYIDTQSIVCDNTMINYDNCKLFDDAGMPKSYDGSHLTKFGAKFFGVKLIDQLDCLVFYSCINTGRDLAIGE
jgi:peptidoglycan/LPS O-acetylase OafA/YrhL